MVYKVIKTLHYLNLRINYKASLSRRCRGKGQGKTGNDILPFHALRARLIQFLWKYLIHADGILKMPTIYIQIRFIGSVVDLKNLFRYSEDHFWSRGVLSNVSQDSFSTFPLSTVLSFDIIVLMSRSLFCWNRVKSSYAESRKRIR